MRCKTGNNTYQILTEHKLNTLRKISRKKEANKIKMMAKGDHDKDKLIIIIHEIAKLKKLMIIRRKKKYDKSKKHKNEQITTVIKGYH